MTEAENWMHYDNPKSRLKLARNDHGEKTTNNGYGPAAELDLYMNNATNGSIDWIEQYF